MNDLNSCDTDCLYCRTFQKLKHQILIDEYMHWEIVSHTNINRVCFYARLIFSPLTGYHLSWERYMDTISKDELELYYMRFYSNHKHHSKSFAHVFEFFELPFQNITHCSQCDYSKEYLQILKIGSIYIQNQQDLDRELEMYINDISMQRDFALQMCPMSDFMPFNRIELCVEKTMHAFDIAHYVDKYLHENRSLNETQNLKDKTFEISETTVDLELDNSDDNGDDLFYY